MLHAVIMAGGSGTRFWPVSRQKLPKQFLNITGERSLIQTAFDRCQPVIPAERFWVVTNTSMIPTTAEHLPDVPGSHLVAEPCGRNTAPCVALAAMLLTIEDPEAVMLVMPADHVISPHERFQQAVNTAVTAVQEDASRLVLFGVPPTSPATGFGYIERGAQLGDDVYQVATFREKPDRDTATSYLEQGTFYWNCGIFVWQAKTILHELASHQPEIASRLEELKPAVGTDQWDIALQSVFPQMPSISIDYAVLEHASSIAVVEAPFDWDDVGSWEAMARLNPTDEQGNTVLGKAALTDCRNCIVRSTIDHTVAVSGLDNCIVVQTADATLVADRRDENAVRKLVDHLREHGFDDVL